MHPPTPRVSHSRNSVPPSTQPLQSHLDAKGARQRGLSPSSASCKGMTAILVPLELGTFALGRRVHPFRRARDDSVLSHHWWRLSGWMLDGTIAKDCPVDFLPCQRRDRAWRSIIRTRDVDGFMGGSGGRGVAASSLCTYLALWEQDEKGKDR